MKREIIVKRTQLSDGGFHFANIEVKRIAWICDRNVVGIDIKKARICQIPAEYADDLIRELNEVLQKYASR